MMLLATLCTILALPVAALTDSPNLLSLEPRRDGSADVSAFIQELSTTQARYARLVRGKREVGDTTASTSHKNTRHAAEDSIRIDDRGTKVKRADVQAAPDSGPPLAPVNVLLKEQRTPGQWTYPEGVYLANSSIRSQEHWPFSTRFDTLEVDYLVPSHTCGPADGCPGNAVHKYLGMGSVDPVSIHSERFEGNHSC